MRRRTLLVATLLVSAAADSDVEQPDGFRMDDYRAPVPATVPGGLVLHVPEVDRLAEQGEVVLIDVLPAPRRPPNMRPGAPWLPVTHRDLPGSLWWPDVGRGALSPDVEAEFRARLLAVSAQYPGRRMVFYCLDQCWMSWNAAKRAASYGFPAAWFPEGADGWAAAGHPTAPAAPDFLD